MKPRDILLARITELRIDQLVGASKVLNHDSRKEANLLCSLIEIELKTRMPPEQFQSLMTELAVESIEFSARLENTMLTESELLGMKLVEKNQEDK